MNSMDQQMPAHLEYHLIRSWWHPDKNQGKQPGDITRGSKDVWLRCPGCKHGCGR